MLWPLTVNGSGRLSAVGLYITLAAINKLMLINCDRISINNGIVNVITSVIIIDNTG